ncbi:MAG: glycosyltransferase family 4 protein [Candidatus Bilamarchaeaceae archaeon]
MKILLLTQWYPPEPAELLEELACALKEKGNEIYVLTGFPNYPSGKIYSGYKLKLLQKEIRKDIPITRVFLFPDHSRIAWRRAFNYISFSISALYGSLFIQKPDLIYAYHPPLTIGLPAYILSKRWKIPFVYNIQDMWPETLQATNMLNNKVILNLINKCSLWVYKKASAIFVISPGFYYNLIEKGVNKEKIYIIPNWVDHEFFRPLNYDSELAKQLDIHGKFNILYAGNIGEAQGLESVIEAAELLKNISRIHFLFAGDGTALNSLKNIVEKKNLNNVRFLGRYPANFMPKLYSIVNVLLVHLKDEPLFRITIPHKIYTYMAAAKPILAAVSGDGADEIKNAKAGIVCAPQNPESIAEAVLQLYQMPCQNLYEMGLNGREYVKQYRNIINISSKINNILLNIFQNFVNK